MNTKLFALSLGMLLFGASERHAEACSPPYVPPVSVLGNVHIAKDAGILLEVRAVDLTESASVLDRFHIVVAGEGGEVLSGTVAPVDASDGHSTFVWRQADGLLPVGRLTVTYDGENPSDRMSAQITVDDVVLGEPASPPPAALRIVTIQRETSPLACNRVTNLGGCGGSSKNGALGIERNLFVEPPPASTPAPRYFARTLRIQLLDPSGAVIEERSGYGTRFTKAGASVCVTATDTLRTDPKRVYNHDAVCTSASGFSLKVEQSDLDALYADLKDLCGDADGQLRAKIAAENPRNGFLGAGNDYEDPSGCSFGPSSRAVSPGGLGLGLLTLAAILKGRKRTL